MEDALGNKIEIGNWYGYSRVSNGITNIVIGKAEKCTNKKIKLVETIKQWGVTYNLDSVGTGYPVHVYSKTVFPIDINKLNLEK